MSHFACRICTESFTLQEDRLPRVLACAHTFCHSCLSEWSARSTDKETKDDSNSVECPTCRAPNTIPSSGFPPNYILLDFLEAKNSGTPPKQPPTNKTTPSGTCSECDQSATLYCNRCGDLCETCSASIHQLAKTHTVCSIQNKPEPEHYCDEHPSEPIKLFCTEESCQRVVCGICPGAKHYEHSLELLNEAAFEKREVLLDSLTMLKEYITTNQEWMNEIQAEHDRIESEQKETSAKITASTAKITECVQQRETALQQQLEKICSKKLNYLDQLKSICADVASELSAIRKVGRSSFFADGGSSFTNHH